MTECIKFAFISLVFEKAPLVQLFSFNPACNFKHAKCICSVMLKLRLQNPGGHCNYKLDQHT